MNTVFGLVLLLSLTINANTLTKRSLANSDDYFEDILDDNNSISNLEQTTSVSQKPTDIVDLANSTDRFDQTTFEPISQELIECPDGWVYGAGRCYYLDIFANKHDSAERICNLRNGTLAIIRDNKEFEFIKSLTSRFSYVHVGASSNSQYSGMQWSDGTTLSGSSPYWCEDYPSNCWNSLDKCCAEMRSNGDLLSGCLGDYSCNDEDPFICEMIMKNTSSSSYNQGQPLEPLHHWSFDSSQNDVVGNISPYRRANTIYTNDRNGNADGAIDLSDDYIQLYHLEYFDKSFTLSAWVKLKEYRDWQVLIDCGSLASQNNLFITLSAGPDNVFGLYSNISMDSQYFVYPNTNGTLELNKWTHLTFVVKRQIQFMGSGNVRIFMNGEMVASSTDDFQVASVMLTKCLIGKSFWYANDPYLNAAIDDLKIFDRELTDIEVRENMKLSTFRNRQMVQDETTAENIVSTLNTQDTTKSMCPIDWIYGAGRCFYLESSRKSHVAAERACHLKGGTLATIRNDDELTFLTSLSRQHVFVHVGASYNTVNNFTWTDGTRLQDDSSYWCKSEPNGCAGYLNKCCAQIRTEDNCLADYSCDDLDPSICELYPSISSSSSLPEELTKVADTITDRDNTQCPSDWVNSDGRCYFIELTMMTHDDAQTSCQSRGGALVVIRNDAQYESIKAITSRLNYFHIGATASQPKQFKWSDGRAIQYSSYWCRNQPDNYEGSEYLLKQGCLQFHVSNFCMFDYECDNKEMSVCEMSLSFYQTKRLNETMIHSNYSVFSW